MLQRYYNTPDATRLGRNHTVVQKVNQSRYRPEVPRGLQEIKVPRLRDSGPGWW